MFTLIKVSHFWLFIVPIIELVILVGYWYFVVQLWSDEN